MAKILSMSHFFEVYSLRKSVGCDGIMSLPSMMKGDVPIFESDSHNYRTGLWLVVLL